MPFLLTNWKLLLLATLFAASVLFFKLWRSEVADFTAFKIEVAAIGKAAEAVKLRIEAEHAKTTKEIKNAIPKKLAAARSTAVANYIASLPAHSSSGSLPGPSDCPCGTDGTGEKSVLACTERFIEDAGEDAARIGLWQDWARGIGFPLK